MIDASLKRVSLFLKNIVNAMCDEPIFTDVPRITTPDIDDFVCAIGCLEDAADPDPDEINLDGLWKECWGIIRRAKDAADPEEINLDELGME